MTEQVKTCEKSLEIILKTLHIILTNSSYSYYIWVERWSILKIKNIVVLIKV